MHYSLLLPLWAIAAFAVYKAVDFVLARRHAAAKAKSLGCQEAPKFDGGFLGIKQMKAMQAADKAMLFPDLMLERMAEMSQKTGRLCSTWAGGMLGEKMYFTADPKNIQAMLATQFEDFCLGQGRRNNMEPTLGYGIFVQDGKAWEHSRAMLRPNFVRDQVSDLELEERHVQNLMNLLQPGSDGWTPETDIQTLFFRLTIDSATEFLFGESVDSQIAEAASNGHIQNDKAFGPNFDNAQKHIAKRFRLGGLYWTHNPKEYRDNNKVVNDFAQRYVDRALRKTQPATKKVDGKEHYIFLDAVAQQTRDPEVLRAQLLNILLAGRDTTASLLSWLFHQLLRNPEIFAKLRQTVVDTFGTYEEPQDISFATLKGCQYLQLCINETLRLWTVVPGNGRRTTRDTTLPRGGGPDGNSPIFVAANTQVDYSIHVMHRRKDLWGEDADKFRPERFIGRKAKETFDYLPFNGGPRICIGQQFALTEASYVVVRLLQRFDQISASSEELEGPILSALSLTSCPGRLVKLKLHEARD